MMYLCEAVDVDGGNLQVAERVLQLQKDTQQLETGKIKILTDVASH